MVMRFISIISLVFQPRNGYAKTAAGFGKSAKTELKNINSTMQSVTPTGEKDRVEGAALILSGSSQNFRGSRNSAQERSALSVGSAMSL